MLSKLNKNDLNIYAQKIIEGYKLSDYELKSLLLINTKSDLDKLHYIACKVKDNYFGNKIFLYSFVYFSTFCKNKCSFCYYNTNNCINRYRLNLNDVHDICKKLKGESINMVDLTMGEDPYFYQNPEKLAEIVNCVKKELNLPIMISPGVLEDDIIEMLYTYGANFFALYQETYDEKLYEKLRVGQSFQNRIHARQFAKQLGYYIEDGLLIGMGEDIDSIIVSLKQMIKNNPNMVRAMTFIPQEGTPLEHNKQSSNLSELKIISILRLLFPDRLIPASLDVEGIEGMVLRLNAGANVVTSIIPSESALEGVANYDRNHLEKRRDAKSVVEKLRQMGMEPASQYEFNRILEVMT